MRLHVIERTALSLAFIAVFGVGFTLLDARHAELAWALTPAPLDTPVDATIPFVPGFIFAYLLYYPFLLLPVLVLRRRDDFYRAVFAFVLLQACAVAVYVLLPSRMVRPSLSGLPDGLALTLVAWLYQMDHGWNVFPSLHVAHSSLIAMLYWVHRPRMFPAVALGALLIAASTVLVKQHYLVDVPAGALLAWLCLRAARIGRADRPGDALRVEQTTGVHASASRARAYHR